MKLRVVTATLGRSQYWTEMLKSMAVAAPEAEHVVVCPAERTTDLAGAAAKFRLVSQHTSGLYPALNQALREPGDWDAFTWINDDDVLRAPGFGALVEKLARASAVDVVYGRVALIDSRGARVGELPVARCVDDLPALFARGIIPFAQPGTIIRRRVWEQLKGIDESYRIVGDMDFFIRAVVGGARFQFVDDEAAAFRLNAGQLSKIRDEVETETARALRPLAGRRRVALASLRFRLVNLGVYFERVRRHGFVSMRELYDRTE